MKRITGIIMAVALAVSAPLATARDFRSADIHPADYPTVEAVKFMGKQLAAASGGKLGVKVFPNGALGSEKDTIEQLKIGALDMMRINASPLNNFVPETIALCSCPSSSGIRSTCAPSSTGRSATRSWRRWSPLAWWGLPITIAAPGPFTP
ncbi:TRAP-type C4-dicarboxylate transport system substrate-binding protein [Bradyrhizobium liaoningense]